MLQSPSKRNDLSLLIQAIEYVENQSNVIRSYDQEHGYAAHCYNVGSETLKSKMKSFCKGHNRTSHNELEKNRRAHLRTCLDNLKAIVPLQGNAARHTTLGLLNQARSLILNLKEEKESLYIMKSQVYQRNSMLKRALLHLEVSRRRMNSTGSAWSSGLSESSNDSDKDEEIIDVTECGERNSVLKKRTTLPTSLITINVPKALTLPSRSSKPSIHTTKRIDL